MPSVRRMSRSALVALAATALTSPVLAQVLPGAGVNAYGMPGVIDMPTATALPDGTLATTLQAMPGTWRVSMAFQALPRLTVSFRYAAARIGFGPTGFNHDRSFDLHWQATDEGRFLPALAIGLRDIIGTGIYSGEYVVATRTINPRLRASLGIGWGRLATHGAFTNPLAALNDGFRTRPGGFTGQGGIIEAGRWFRGPAAAFAAVEYQATDRLTLLAEYSSDSYPRESRFDLRYSSPVNVGFTYRIGRASSVSGYLMHGGQIGVHASFALNPAQPSSGAVRLAAPPPVRIRPEAPAGAGFSTSWAESAQGLGPRLHEALTASMQAEGLRLEGVELEARRVVVRFTNQRHDVLPRAIGRSARILSYGLPESVEEIVLIPTHGNVVGTAVVLSRSDLERYEHDPDGAAELFARARFADPLGFPGVARAWQPLHPTRQRFEWTLSPYLDLSYFDPRRPVRAEVGLRAQLRYSFAENFSVNLTASQPVTGNIGANAAARPTPGYPQVRTNTARYYTNRFSVDRLTADYTFRPATDVFGRVTVGWLERMYAGVSAEVLWAPPDSRLALGVELNRVAQRDPGALLGVNNLRLWTGHVSAYYDIGGGFYGQLDVGQYLAGDRGATIRLERVFGSGMRIGAWATLTDMPFAVFGEGSFDKGFSITIPLTALTGQPSTSTLSSSIRSLSRDGGAVLQVPGRLYPTIQSSRRHAMQRGWGAVLQ